MYWESFLLLENNFMTPRMTTNRTTMNAKPVIEIAARTIINFKSAFKEKLLCDGPTFSTGTACA